MMGRDNVSKDVESATLKLLAYCRSNDWAGIEPYDALNSPLFRLRLMDSRIPRLVFTQGLKRSPINVRGLLGIQKAQNPKALGLFLSAFVKLAKIEVPEAEEQIAVMIQRLTALRSPRKDYWCWGYCFPWQTRTVLVPRWEANLVCTAFAASGLLEAYDLGGDSRCLEMAISAAEFILNELFWSRPDGVAGFGYPLPQVRNQVHNANFLGAELLCRVYRHTGQQKFLDAALLAARYSAGQQQPDGSWLYGESASQKWIDNFHTGFNLSALDGIGRYAETAEFEQHIRRGLTFYHAFFFREDGAVRYYHDQTYPIDAHCVAQSIISLLDLKHLDPQNVPLAYSVWRWAMDHLWDDRGYFYYRILRTCTIRTSYMRWTQAWMFLALSKLLVESREKAQTSPAAVAAVRG